MAKIVCQKSKHWHRKWTLEGTESSAMGSQNFRRLRRAKSGFHYRGVFRYTYSERHPTPPIPCIVYAVAGTIIYKPQSFAQALQPVIFKTYVLSITIATQVTTRSKYRIGRQARLWRDSSTSWPARRPVRREMEVESAPRPAPNQPDCLESVRVPAYPPTVPRACKISCETQERHQQERHQQ